MQKSWPMLNIFVDEQRNRQTGQKLYGPQSIDIWAKEKALILPSVNVVWARLCHKEANGLDSILSSMICSLIKIIIITLYHTMMTFGAPEKKLLKTLWRKGVNAGNHHFLLFPQCFLPYERQNSVLSVTFNYYIQVHRMVLYIGEVREGVGVGGVSPHTA